MSMNFIVTLETYAYLDFKRLIDDMMVLRYFFTSTYCTYGHLFHLSNRLYRYIYGLWIENID